MRLFYSLRFRLTILFLLIIIVPIMIITSVMPYYYQTLISNETQKATEGTTIALSNYIQTYLNDLERLTIAPYLNENVMYALKLKANGNTDTNAYDNLVAYQALYYTLPDYLQNTREDIVSTILIPNDGSVFITSANGPTDHVSGFPFEKQDWYKEAVKADGNAAIISAHTQNYLVSPSASTVFSVARLIKDPDSGKPLGVMMADASTVVLSNIIDKIPFSVDSITCIIDDKNRLLYSSQSISKSIMNQIADQGKVKDNTDRTYEIVSKTIEPSKWKIVVLLSYSEIKSKVHWMYVMGMVFAAGGFLVTILVFLYLSRWIMRPFKEMIRAMRNVQNGDLTVQLHTKGKDEIAQLGETFNGMIHQINDLINREYRAVLSQRDAEYRALQSQIHPHFLYNTLNGFIGLNRLGEQKILETSILSLSTMLRYTLEHADWATIAEEFSFLETYCSLQKLRFSERLTTQIVHNETIAGFKIPKLLLQPLVENSIVHGIEPSGTVSSLYVAAEINKSGSQPMIEFVIQDTGVGFDVKTTLQTPSIGLTNVAERLKFAFPDSSFDIESRLQIGTKITIRIPIKGDLHEGSTC